MSHIVEFAIGGLAGHKGVYKRKLDRHLNIFFGVNGSGKTSLLRILDSAMENNAYMLNNVPFRWAQVTIYSITYNKEFVATLRKPKAARFTRGGYSRRARLEKSDIGEREEEVYGFPGRPDRRGKTMAWEYKPRLPQGEEGNWVHLYLPTWRLYRGFESSTRVAYGETQRASFDWDIFFAESLRALWSTYTNELLSKVRDIQQGGLANILKGILSTKSDRKKAGQLDAKTAFAVVSAFLKRQKFSGTLGTLKAFAKRYEGNDELRRVVSDINFTEQSIQKAMVSRNKLEQLIRRMFSGNKTIEFKDTGIDVQLPGGSKISLNLLSSGEKHALYIFIETLLAGDSSLLIDEPEISLHIDWQKRLISSMRQLNPGAQLILATHSPDIMADIRDENIFKL